MPIVSEMPQSEAGSVRPPVPARRIPPKPGRQADPPAEASQTTAQTPPAESPEPDSSFFSRLKAGSIADWERWMVYLYRLQPITDTTNGGKDRKYLARYTSPFDEDSVMKDFGSGTYRAQWNERVGAKDKVVCQHVFEIENPKYPPVVPKGAWIDDPRNAKWESWFKTDTPAPAAAGSNLTEAFGLVQQILKQINPEASAQKEHDMVTAVLDAVKETRRELSQQNSPDKLFDAVKAFTPLIAPFITRLAAPQDNGLADLVKLQAQQIHEMRMEMMKQSQHSSGLGSIKEVVSTIALLREQFPAAAAAAESSPKWLEMLGPALQYGFQMLGNRGGPPATPPPAAIFQHQPAVAAAPIQENPAVPASTEPGAQPPAEAPRQYTQEEVAEIQQIVMSAARPMFNFLSKGQDGLAFADYFIEGNSLREWQILKTFGYDNLLIMIQQHKAAWLMLSPMLPQFQQFMQEFYNWTPAIDEQAEPNDPAAAAPEAQA